MKDTVTKTWVGILLTVVSHATSSQAIEGPVPTPGGNDDSATDASEPHAATPEELGEDATLTDFLRYAALHNPGLQSAYYEWIGALEKVPQVKALPDPRFSYGYYFQEVETFAGPQRQRINLSQMFPWFGKLSLRGDVASQNAEAAHQRFEAKKLELVFQVTEAYAEYYYLARALDVTQENVELLTDWEVLTRARYRVAVGEYADVIKAQVELGKLDDQFRTLEDLRIPTMARLNEVLGRRSTAPLPLPIDLPPERAVFSDEDLLRELSERNPELRALDATVTAEERSIELAKKEYFPDLTLGVEWIDTERRSGSNPPDNGKDAVIGMVSVNLPIWWQKISAGIREAQARRLAAGNKRSDRALALTTSLQRALYGFRDAERKIDLYGDGLIPKGREALAAEFTAYESAKADFLDLLDAQRVLLEFRLSYERALANHAQRRAEIEMVVGKPLPTEGASKVDNNHEESR